MVPVAGFSAGAAGVSSGGWSMAVTGDRVGAGVVTGAGAGVVSGEGSGAGVGAGSGAGPGAVSFTGSAGQAG